MKYNLEKFNKVISDIITNPNKKLGNNIAHISLNNLLKEESTWIKREIRETVFILKSDNKIEHYLHKQQLAIENLIAFVVQEINPEHRNNLYKISKHFTQSDCLKIVYYKLEKLQIFLETEYFNYINLDRSVPYRTLVKRDKEIAPKVASIRQCKPFVKLSIEMFQIICKLLRLNHKNNITYNQYIYYNELTTDLLLLLRTENKTITDEVMSMFLAEMNYNSTIFFKFQTDKISEELNSITSGKDKIDHLLRILKTYNQISPITRSAYNKKRISHQEQIVNWVEEEIKYLSQINILNKPNSTSQTALLENKTKIKIDLSVAQLSYFFSLLNDSGIIKAKSQREIFRFVAENFETSKSGNISASSVGNKFYNIETNTKEVIKSLIIKLLNLAK